MLRAGLVIAVPDPKVQPRNRRKWHICVCPEARLFLRINSKPLWPPWHFLQAGDNAFLRHDSYVELTELHFFADGHTAAEIGQLTANEARKLAEAARWAVTLSRDKQDLIWENLANLK
jgi:hypothetical protein